MISVNLFFVKVFNILIFNKFIKKIVNDFEDNMKSTQTKEGIGETQIKNSI